MRTTSAKAYREGIEDGSIAKSAKRVLEYLRKYGPMTGRQLDHAIPGGHKRLIELDRAGIIHVVDRKPDSQTGKTSIYWGVCEAPMLSYTPQPKRQTRKELEVENARLMAALNEYLMKMSKLYDKAFKAGYFFGEKGLPMPEDI